MLTVRIGAPCGINIQKVKDEREEKCYFLEQQGCMVKDFYKTTEERKRKLTHFFRRVHNCGKENLESSLGLFSVNMISRPNRRNLT